MQDLGQTCLFYKANENCFTRTKRDLDDLDNQTQFQYQSTIDISILYTPT